MSQPRTICLFAHTDSGKTTQVGRFARFVREKSGKRIRLISADPNGWDCVQHLVDAELIEPWSITGLERNPLSVLYKLARGDWPEAGPDEKLRLVPATAETWAAVGGYAIEGVSTISELLERHLRATGPKLAENPSYQYNEKGMDGDKDLTVYGSNPSYVGFIQREMMSLVIAFGQLPVERVLWTAHEAIGEEEDTRLSIFGPDMAGKKGTGKAPKWFSTLFHIERVVAGGKPGTPHDIQRRIWFASHSDARTGQVISSKPRVPAELYSELLKRWSKGYLEPRVVNGEMLDGLDDFLRFEDELIERAGEAVRGRP